VEVDIDFERPEEVKGMLVGYSADAEIVLAERENTLREPTSTQREGKRVLLYRADDGRLEERVVKAGVSNWEFTEVLEGLAEGDRIAASLERECVM
ncbi:efflux RND transporter periplasmic adaptor subunit, partial [Aromatoleum toluclasticum]|nr:efflux RND transporter periplasmic adaptor subunit [Aromatoleum toluclasticum]